MPKQPPSKGKPPAAGEPSGAKDVTSSQIVSTRDLGAPPLPPPPARPPRRSTTHGVGWYGSEDGEDLALPVQARRGKMIFVVALLTVILFGLAGAYLFVSRGGKATPAVAPPVAAAAPPDAAPPPPDAAAARMAHLSLTSTPPGADFVVDGKPVGKAPTEIDVAEKSKVVVEATLAEHQPWREEVEVAAKGKKVTARLVPLAADAGPPDASVPAKVAAPTKKVVKPPVKKTIKKKPVPTRKKKRATHR